MANLKNSSNSQRTRVLADYRPAKLHRSKADWRIIYYVKHPVDDKMIRFRKRVKAFDSVNERLKYAELLIDKINRKLIQGWNPILDQQNHQYTTIKEAISNYHEYIQAKVKANVMRPGTIRSYLSQTGKIAQHLDQKGLDPFTFEYDKTMMLEILDEFIRAGKSTRTHNNFLKVNIVFWNWMIEREYCKVNVPQLFKKLKNEEAKSVLFPDALRDRLFAHLDQHNKPMLLACYLTYYCFVRPNEIRHLQLKHLDISNNLIRLTANVTKNRKSENITLMPKVKALALDILDFSSPDDYILSVAFRQGKTPIAQRTFENHYNYVRRDLNISRQYNFYSLKHTGITNMLHAGVAPIKVKEQARHADLSITEAYIKRIGKADQDLLDLDF